MNKKALVISLSVAAITAVVVYDATTSGKSVKTLVTALATTL